MFLGGRGGGGWREESDRRIKGGLCPDEIDNVCDEAEIPATCYFRLKGTVASI